MSAWFGSAPGTESNVLNSIWESTHPNCAPMLAHLSNALPIGTVRADGKELVGYVVVCRGTGQGGPACVAYGGLPSAVGTVTEAGTLPCEPGQDAHVILYWR